MTKPFQSPSYLQLEGVSAPNELLALSCSSLGGNEWHGELRLFQQNERNAFETVGAVRLDRGSACCRVFNADSMVACGTDAGDVLVFKISSERSFATTAPSLKLLEHDDVVTGIDVNEELNQAVSSSWDRTVKVWDLTTGKAKETLSMTEHVSGVQYVDTNLLACGERDGSISVWDTRKGMVARKTLDHGIASIVSSKREFIIVGCANGSVIEWAHASNMVQELRKHNAAVHALAICPQTERLLSGSDDGVVFGEGRLHHDFVRGAAWWKGRPVTSSWDGTMRFVDVDMAAD